MKKMLARYPIGNPRRKWKQDNFMLSVTNAAPMGLEYGSETDLVKARCGMKTAKEAGFNMVELLWASPAMGMELVRMAERLSMPVIYQNMLRFGGMGYRKEKNIKLEDNDLEGVIRDIAPWKSVVGLCIYDEPLDTEQRALTKELIDRMEELCPDKLPFACTDSGKIDLMADEVDPAQLSFDQYAFGGWAGGGMDRENQMDRCLGYWEKMEIAKNAAKRIDAPFWFYYQGHELSYNPVYDDYSFAASRMMANAALLYGAKGVSCYNEFDGAFNPENGGHGIYFEEQLKLNREIAALGNTLMALRCKRVIHDESLKTENSKVHFASMEESELLKGKLPKRISVSEFVDAYGNDYLMVLNRDYKNDRRYVLDLKEERRVWRVSDTDGKERLAFDDGKNKIMGTLTPGSIALYRLQKKDEEPCAIEYYLDKGTF